jgi:hypothetical protein
LKADERLVEEGAMGSMPFVLVVVFKRVFVAVMLFVFSVALTRDVEAELEAGEEGFVVDGVVGLETVPPLLLFLMLASALFISS